MVKEILRVHVPYVRTPAELPGECLAGGSFTCLSQSLSSILYEKLSWFMQFFTDELP